MTIEKFLSFWDQHNVRIIESLVGLIVLLVLLQAYRIFFGKKSADEHDLVSSGGLDAAQLEKTLQKILDAQSTHARAKGDEVGAHHDDDAPVSPATAEVAAVNSEEVAQLKQALAERQSAIEALQAQVKAAATEAPIAEAPAAPGLSDDEKKALDDKIRDLEARLAEYEIISEDIADLSKFKDENEKLRAELKALTAGGGAPTLCLYNV